MRLPPPTRPTAPPPPPSLLRLAVGSSYSFDWYQGWAGFAILVYPIGVPVFFFLVLFVTRDELFEPGTDTPNPDKAEQLGFLYAGYTKKYWWWECVELFRKLMLTGILAFFKPGSPEQLFMAILLAVAFIVGYAREKPYKQASASDLQLICQLQIFFVSVTGFAVKMSDMVVAASGTGKSPFSSPGFGDLLLSIGCMPMVLGFMQSMMALVQQMQGLASDKMPVAGRVLSHDEESAVKVVGEQSKKMAKKVVI